MTVAIVTKPFMFEGQQRRGIAEAGLEELIEKVDTIIKELKDFSMEQL